MDAVVYTSNTGHTKKYADLFGKKTGLKVYEFDEAKKALGKNSKVIYFGWMKQGKIVNYQKAVKEFDVKAVCAVGMSLPGGKSEESTREQSHIVDTIQVFYLQGGFQFNQLTGMNRFVMKTFMKTMVPAFEKRDDLSEEEACMLKVFKDGGNFVSIDNLSPVFEWYAGLKTQ